MEGRKKEKEGAGQDEGERVRGQKDQKKEVGKVL